MKQHGERLVASPDRMTVLKGWATGSVVLAGLVAGVSSCTTTKECPRCAKAQEQPATPSHDARAVATPQALADGLKWLAEHQDEDGRWSCAEFMKHDPPDAQCDGAGDQLHDVGMTGLALLAFLGDGNTFEVGPYRKNVTHGIKWLTEQQDEDSGLLGKKIGHGFIYDHAIASLALCEAYYLGGKNPLIGKTAQNAINFITRARNPYGAWRYEFPPNGENDTSVTGWMVLALRSAKEAGLKIDKAAFTGAMSWFDEVTDPATGRVGYTEIGSHSSRIQRVNDNYPPEKGEALTAIGLLGRFLMGQDPETDVIMVKHANLMRSCLPEWDPEGFGCDMYYWYHGSYAMYQMGGNRYWEPWSAAMQEAILKSQRRDGSFKGSWDPVGPWGFSGGRVYSTALMVLSLEVYFRYAQILGAR